MNSANANSGSIAIRQWLEQQGLGKYAELFAENAIEIDVLPAITDLHLEKLGLPLGDRIRLQRAIAAHVNEKRASSPQSGEAGRRQLTVMFCDLVGSTELSARMDPEDYREVIRRYQSAATRVIHRYEGYVAQYMGDGLLVYFGYPLAHEDDPERAIRTGLDLVAALGALESDKEPLLRVRIGISTGLVVVGESIGEGASEMRAVLGETPNLAARLQSMAEPNSVIVAAATKRLVEGRVEFERLGEFTLKGISKPVTAYRATQVRESGRVEALERQGLTGFVGRARELETLRQRWESARDGHGQVVLLGGEPGIGKSLLSEVLRQRLQGESHVFIRYQCTPFHVNSAFHPAIEQLARAAGIGRADDSTTRLKKLDALFHGNFAEHEKESSLALLAALMSLDQTGYRPLDMSPRQQKTETIALLVRQLEGLANRTPALVLVEDAHWIDPSTRELLDALVSRVAAFPVLLLITHRPEFECAWTSHGHVTTCVLRRLSRPESEAIARQLIGEQALPAEILAQIVERTDGIPLFVEEMTKSVLESKQGDDGAGDASLTRTQRLIAVPSTLHDSLMARLDRLGAAKEVAQICAAIGREFSHELLAASAQMAEPELGAALDELIASRLIYRRGLPPGANYKFKHALVRDAAYDSMLRRRRQDLHAHIGHVLEERFPETADTEPELLAGHYAMAGFAGTAIKYWRKAGNRAFQRSAVQEAVSHFSRALELVPELADPGERLEQEIASLTGMGEALMLSKGYAAPEVRTAYERAEVLARDLGETSRAVGVVFGLWAFHHVRAHMTRARALAERICHIANRIHDAEANLAGSTLLGITTHCIGDLEVSRECHERVVRDYRFDPQSSRARTYVTDPGALSRAYLALTVWYLGFPEKALRLSAEALQHARAIAHPYTLATVLALTARFHQIRRDLDHARTAADETIAVSTHFDFPIWRILGIVLSNWVRAESGDDEGVEQMQAAIASYRKIGVRVSLPYYAALLAEQCARRGRIDEALAMIADAKSEMVKSKAHAEECEISRLHCEILRLRGPAENAIVELRLRAALSVAEAQRALAWRLRISISLARLLRDDGRASEARQLLAAERGRMTEGTDCDDLRASSALLIELA